MRRIGLWQFEPPPPEAFEFRSAFAMDTMAFIQWLQFVLIPRVRDLMENGGEWPSDSYVGVKAVRELDGVDEAEGLISLLSEFDGLFAGA
jgi:uncharacterized protein YqcC (DUF446 family)